MSSPDLPTTRSPPSAREGLSILRKSPVPLNAAQEGEVRELYYKRVRSKCADEIREFAQCATGRTFSIPFVCRQQRLSMEKCMNTYATQEEQDAARVEWFTTQPERQRQKEDEERHKQELRQKKREWWAEYTKSRNS